MTDTPPPTSPLATPLPWDLVADVYDAKLRPWFEAYARHALGRLALAPGARLADVACGPGTLALLAHGQGLEVDALDFAPAMIARLRAAAPTLRAVVGDGQALPWPDASFAAACSMFGLMFFPDRARGYRELARVLVPGGRAVVSSWAPLSEVPLLASSFAALGAVEPSFAAGPPARPALTTAAEHEAEMAAAGFVDVTVETVVHAQPAPSARAFWSEFQGTSAPLVLAQRRFGPERWAAIAEGVAERLDAQWGAGPITVAFPALLGFGTRA